MRSNLTLALLLRFFHLSPLFSEKDTACLDAGRFCFAFLPFTHFNAD